MNKLKALAGKVFTNEVYTVSLITIGVPAIFYIYLDWKAALTSFVLVQITLGIVRERAD